MIFDKENLFFKDQALSATTLTSDIIDVGPGESSEPMKLVVNVTDDAGAGSIVATVQTSETTDFTSPFSFMTATSPTFSTSFTIADMKGAPIISAPIARGNKGYLRVSAVSTFTDGEMTAGLVLDDDIPTTE